MKKIVFAISVMAILAGQPWWLAADEYPRRNAIVAAVEKVRNSVVSIQTETTERTPVFQRGMPFPGFFPPMNTLFPDITRVYRVPSLASGVLIDEQGHVLTNEHVVSGALTARVIHQGVEYDCQLIGTDEAMDLAVLRIVSSGKPDFRPVQLGRSDDLMIGETTIVIGNNLGYEHTVTVGVISGTERSLHLDDRGKQYFGLVQTDAAINRGNSGGPLLNINGEMIGITTVIATSGEGFEGVGFAIPSARIRQIYREFVLGEISLQRRLDVWVQTASSLVRELGYSRDALQDIDPDNLVVRFAHQDGLAYLNGIKPGDIITQINNKSVRGFNEWRRALEEHKEAELKLTYLRSGREENMVLDTTQMRPGDHINLDDVWFGAKVEGLTSSLAQRLGVHLDSGIVVTAVEPNSPADEVNLEPGDLITNIGSATVKDLARFRRLRHEIQNAEWVEMVVLRNGVDYLVRMKRKML